jgi:uncharacterized protein (TIGR02001 family)
MKKTLLSISFTSILATTTLFSTQASAVDGLSANVAATNNYLWRGLEQTGGASAISGGVDYSASSGFYVGTWASNASWGDMKTELDLYAGYGGKISDSVSYDIGFIYFGYPDSISGDAAFSEVYANFSFDALTLGLAVLADADGADAGDSTYASADYSFSVATDAELALHIGAYSGDFSTDSVDIGVSISKNGFTFGLSKTDYDDGVDSDDVKFYVSYSVDIDL